MAPGTGAYRRVVIYVHGFDVRGPAYFNKWQRREARAYSQTFGDPVVVGPLARDRWHIDGPGGRTLFVFCDWSDIVSDRFATPLRRRWHELPALAWAGLRQGFFGKVLRRDWGIGLLLMWGFAPVALAVIGALLALFWMPPAVLLVAVAYVLFVAAVDRGGRRSGMAYIGHIAWAARRLALGDHPILSARIAAFADLLDRAPAADETLVVGHSLGAPIAVEVLHRARREAHLLTIGQSIPLVSLQREAAPLRQAMSDIGGSTGGWTDVSARRDLLGFYALDPQGDSGARCYPLNLALAFGDRMVRRMRWNGFGLHFLYFATGVDRSQPWDWMAVLAGHKTLASRFADTSPRSGRGGRRLLF